eukprot:9734612-Alexandrium_andersonii.AAC.1
MQRLPVAWPATNAQQQMHGSAAPRLARCGLALPERSRPENSACWEAAPIGLCRASVEGAAPEGPQPS